MKKTAIILGVISILAAFFWNELNVSSFGKHSQKLSHGHTVITADDASYLAPAENWIKHGNFRNNLIGNYAYYMRPPGYSLVYCIFRSVLKTKHALYSLKFFQVLLFGFSISALFLLLMETGTNKRLSIFLSSFYGIGGIGIGFLYYTLTEAITPSLIILSLYSLFKAKNAVDQNRKAIFYSLCFILFGFIFITRPVLGVFALPIVVFILWDNLTTINRRVLYVFSLLFVGFGPMLIWQVRGYNISGEVIGLHPIYSLENKETPYRPVHQAFWEFAKSWGETGEKFHSYTDEFWETNYWTPSDTNTINSILSKIPKSVVNEIGEEKLRDAFQNYRLAIIEQKKHFIEYLEMPKNNFKSENLAIASFNDFTKRYRENHFVFYHFIAPISVGSKMIFHSNLSLQIFQKTWRGNPIMEMWRLVNFLFHSLVFIAFFLVLFLKKSSKEIVLIAITSLLYLLYLAYFQRGIEERYTLPILPLAILSFGSVIHTFLKKVNEE